MTIYDLLLSTIYFINTFKKYAMTHNEQTVEI